jgi:hypothetical protein
VVIRWRTGAEAGLLGFNVYRGFARINARILPARGGLHGTGYRYVDRAVRSGTRALRYRLQVVGIDGTSRWFGPASVRPT